MPAPAYPLHPEPLQRSWLEKHLGWKIPLGALILILLVVSFGGIVMTIITSSFRHSDVYSRLWLGRAKACKCASNSESRCKLRG
jgi:hypothetical protein